MPGYFRDYTSQSAEGRLNLRRRGLGKELGLESEANKTFLYKYRTNQHYLDTFQLIQVTHKLNGKDYSAEFGHYLDRLTDEHRLIFNSNNL